MGFSFKKVTRAVGKAAKGFVKDPIRLLTAGVSPGTGLLVGANDILPERVDGSNIYEDVINAWQTATSLMPGIPIDVRHSFGDININPIRIDPITSEHTVRFGLAPPPTGQPTQGDFAASLTSYLAHAPARLERMRDYVEMTQESLHGGNYLDLEHDALYVQVKLFPETTIATRRIIRPKIRVQVMRSETDYADRTVVYSTRAVANLYPQAAAGYKDRERLRQRLVTDTGNDLLGNLQHWLDPIVENETAAQVRIPINYKKILATNSGFGRYSLQIEIDNMHYDAGLTNFLSRFQIALFRETRHQTQMLSFFDSEDISGAPGTSLGWLNREEPPHYRLELPFPLDLRAYQVPRANRHEVVDADHFLCLTEECKKLKEMGDNLNSALVETQEDDGPEDMPALDRVIRRAHRTLRREAAFQRGILALHDQLKERARTALDVTQDFRQNYAVRIHNTKLNPIHILELRASFRGGTSETLPTENQGDIILRDIRIPVGGVYMTTIFGPPPKEDQDTRMSVRIQGSGIKNGDQSNAIATYVELLTFVGQSAYIVTGEEMQPTNPGDRDSECTIEWVLSSVT